MRKTFIYILIPLITMLLCSTTLKGQEVFVQSQFEVPSQNMLKQNRFYINPTFSKVGQYFSYLNIYHRNQAASFKDNRELYALNYNGAAGRKGAFAIGLLNQREGLIDNMAGVFNYAYNLNLSDDIQFAFGANVIYQITSLSTQRSTALTADDPILSQIQNGSMFVFQPGMNFSFANFDFGFFAENLFEQTFSDATTDATSEDKQNIFSGHLQYTGLLKARRGMFEDATLTTLARAKKRGELDIELGGSLLLDLPKLGWAQLGYDKLYGLGGGIGFKISKNFAVGYTVETGISNLGLTHEILLSYTSENENLEKKLKPLDAKHINGKNKNKNKTPKKRKEKEQKKEAREQAKQQKKAEKENAKVASNVEKENVSKAVEETKPKKKKEATTTETNGRDNEIDGLRKELSKTNELILELIKRQDSIEKRNRALEKELKNLLLLLSQVDKVKAAEIAARTFSSDEDENTDATEIKMPKGETAPKKAENIDEIETIKNTNVKEGYYLILKTLNTQKDLNNAMAIYKRMGVQAGSFEDESTGKKYIYWKRFNSKGEAIQSLNIITNSDYQDNISLIHVEKTSIKKLIETGNKGGFINPKKIKQQKTKDQLHFSIKQILKTTRMT